MSITNSSQHELSKRHQSLRKLNTLFNKIQFLQLNQEDFPTEDLYQLSYYADYSIHPVFSSTKLYQTYLKLSQKYWTSYENLQFINQAERVKNTSSIIQNDQTLELHNIQHIQNPQIQNTLDQSNQIQQISQQSENDKVTETFFEVKQVRLQQKVTKTYHQIQNFFLQFDEQNAIQNQKIGPKIQLLNSWTSVPSKLPNFVQKKAPQLPNKIDSATYLENLKLGKQFRKDSMSSLNTRSIILGKNQSTQTKQMKHMLKVQAKTNFVEQKQKEESKLDILEKKSIELNYLLNVITKDFFNDFFQDILKILRENVGCIQILCEKIIEKVKEEHNFIEIYVELIKKLCKSSISQIENQNQKFNELQVHFVSVLQKSFTKLIQLQVDPSTSNFNEYKYQKQMVGMSQFIGKLIKQKVLSRKIFKVCFWQIVYRYVQKVKENPDQEIVNQCLIEAIVTISDSMSNSELLKLIQKEKENQQSKHMDEVIEINKFQQMMIALVNPNDEEHTKREEEYNNLIESIKVEEYPYILVGLMQIFISKRMKLKFLVENWQQKIETLKTSSLEDVTKMQQQPSRKESVDMIVQEVEQDLIEYDKQLKEFVKQIKHDPIINNLAKNNQVNNKQLLKYENLIKKYIKSQVSQSHSRKVLKLLIVEFLKQFADCKDHNIGIKRIDYFINFVDQLEMKDSNKMILDIICEDELQTLMIIECDYPFLVEGLCHLLVNLIQKVPIQKEKILQKMKSYFSQDDEDMNEFYEKVQSNLLKIAINEKDEILQD